MGGNSGSKSYSQPRQLPPTSSGFLGRGRMAKHYSRDVKIFVNEITPAALARQLVRRCGNEGQHRYLDAAGDTTLRFLREAITFVPNALDDGADMCNTAFILSQPGREFLIQSGSGDWEFYFSENQYGEIYGRNVRKPFLRYVWDGAKSLVRRIGSAIGGLLSIAGSSLPLALAAA